MPMVRNVKLNPAIPRAALPGQRAGRGRRWRRWALRLAAARRDAFANRSRRVVLLLAMLCLVNGFDLAFTLLASRLSHFVEINPIAAALVQTTGALVAFKVLMVLLAFAILFYFRRHLVTELACWGLCGIYAVLAGRWWVYYFLVND